MSTGQAPASPQPLPPDAQLLQLAFGPMLAQALYVAAKLNIADLLAEKPLPINELAARTETHERSLYRILRSLTAVGVFTEAEPKVFALNPVAQLLRTDIPHSMRSGVLFMGAEWHWRVWNNMLYSAKTGKPAWGYVHGAEVFDYFAANPEAAEVFNGAMTDMSMGIAPLITDAYDFTAFTRLVDIAGGHGYMLAQALKSAPDLKGVLFDVQAVIDGAATLLENEGVLGRVERVGGDFFAAVPAGADAYMMKHIIHDWDDERAKKILSNIQSVMADGAKVLIIETVVPATSEPHYSKLLDLEMLTSPGGVERTEEEYRELLAAAGLRLARIVPTASPYSIIEAVKA